MPLSNAVESFVTEQVDAFVASDRFAELWKAAVEVAHGRATALLEGNSDLVQAEGDRIVIDLLPVVNGILAAIGEQSPEIFGRTVDLPTITVDEVPERPASAWATLSASTSTRTSPPSPSTTTAP